MTRRRRRPKKSYRLRRWILVDADSKESSQGDGDGSVHRTKCANSLHACCVSPHLSSMERSSAPSNQRRKRGGGWGGKRERVGWVGRTTVRGRMTRRCWSEVGGNYHNGGNRCIRHTLGHPSTSARPTYERLEIFDFLVSKDLMVVKSAYFSISSVRVISSCANEVINRGRVFTGGARSRY